MLGAIFLGQVLYAVMLQCMLQVDIIQGSFCACAQANERRHYNVMLSLIGWAHTQNDP